MRKHLQFPIMDFSRVGVSELSLDETKQYIAKGGGIRTDIDAYMSCLRL